MRSGRSFDSQYTPFKQNKTALDYLDPFLRFSVHNFCARTDGWTDGRTDIFQKSFLFSSWSRIFIHVYNYLDYFSNFTPILTKVSIPFFYIGNRYENDVILRSLWTNRFLAIKRRFFVISMKNSFFALVSARPILVLTYFCLISTFWPKGR